MNWRSTVTRELKELGERHEESGNHRIYTVHMLEISNSPLANLWRIAAGGAGSFKVDVMHRETLDSILNGEDQSNIESIWSEETRNDLNAAGLMPHPGSTHSKNCSSPLFLASFSTNAPVQAKHADLPWDAVFFAKLFQAYKTNPKANLSVLHHPPVPPERTAIVVTHMYDLHAAGALGMQTVYVPRPGQEGNLRVKLGGVRNKRGGGEVDWEFQGVDADCGTG
ncbi:hypothetical protein BDQ12DRAFT_720283 [Crucibulum laeve]|uniref:Uncharacterized protein n=1 Tax=Crucibulum laeve TaxID=68775 RepID=A0A5C3M977_9AGAR|nr:hypothetical protein BDQ12DRAFT_720283 [Crucibulum laeve]